MVEPRGVSHGPSLPCMPFRARLAEGAARRFFGARPAPEGQPISLILSTEEGSQEEYQLNTALYTLLFVICRKHIVPWYGKLTSDREFFMELVEILRPMIHVLQRRTGAIHASVQGIVPGQCDKARKRVVDTMVNRTPCVLVQHLHQFRIATALQEDQQDSLAKQVGDHYALLAPHSGLSHGKLDNVYLRTTITAFLESIQDDIPDTEERLSDLEMVLVRDILVLVTNNVLATVSQPSVLCRAAHGVLDKLDVWTEPDWVRQITDTGEPNGRPFAYGVVQYGPANCLPCLYPIVLGSKKRLGSYTVTSMACDQSSGIPPAGAGYDLAF